MTQTLAFTLARPISRRPADEAGILGSGSPLLREPVVLTGGTRLMTEVWRWSPEFLRDTVGTACLPATLPGRDGKFRYEPGHALDSQPLPVARFFDDMADQDGPRWCLQQVPVEHELPVLAERLDHPSCVPQNLMKVVNLWLAAPSTVTPLHYDASHNLFAQVSGSKTFYFFPPEKLDALYPGPLNTGGQHVSGIDLFHPDFAQHPLASSLSYRTATVHAGEVLVLPAFWWHQVVSNDVSVSVNFWWRAHVEDCLCPGFMRHLRSAPIQRDLHALTETFELGHGDTKDPVRDAVELVRLLTDIAEYRGAIALSLSILRTVQRQSPAAGKAGDLLARYADLEKSYSRAGPLDAGQVASLTDDIEMIISREIRSWRRRG